MELDWQDIQLKALASSRLIALSDLSAIIVYACANQYADRNSWHYGGETVTDAQWNDIQEATGRMEYQLMTALVGMIFPHAMASIAPYPLLLCDGSQYLRVDYPLLYAVIDPVYIIDADNFRVPDMAEKFPIGTSINFGIDDSGGEMEHILSVAEIPSHSHTNAPHQHTESVALPSVSQLVVVPEPSAVPSAGVTGLQSVVIDPTGGDEAHNNMPPYRAVHFVIVAG